MSDGLNKVYLCGNLGETPNLRFTQGGQAVLNMRLATTESYLDANKERKERTEWHSVVVWGKRGEGLSKILNKGDRILIEGGIRNSSYEDKDGVKRYKTEIHANEVILCGRGRAAGGDSAESGGGYTRGAAPARGRNPDAEDPGGGGGYPDDDIAF